MPQDEYAVTRVSTADPRTLFHGPANRNPVWIGGCRPSSGVSAVCVIDQSGKDPATRELAVYVMDGIQDFRAPAPYADTAQLPQFLGQNGKSYVIVPTLRDKVPGAVVLSASGAAIGTYQGRVFGIDTDRALIMAADPGAGPEPATFNGLDLNGKLVTRLGTVTVRPAGCSWSATNLLCPGPNDFTLWRFAK